MVSLKKYPLFFFIVIFFGVSCGINNKFNVPKPTIIVSPVFTLTPNPTNTPTLKPTFTPTLIPKPSLITKGNIKRLIEITRIEPVYLEEQSSWLQGKMFFSADNKILYIIQTNNKVSKYRTSDWSLIDEKDPSDLNLLSNTIVYSPSKNWVATLNRYFKGIPIFKFPDLKKTYNFGLESEVHSMQFSPDESLFAAGGENAAIFLWNMTNGKRINVEMNHDYSGSDWHGWVGPVWVLKFSKDGTFLASGGNDQTVRLWQMPSGKNIGVFYGHKLAVRGLEISESGKYIASFGDENSFRIWDVKNGNTLGICEGHVPFTLTGSSGEKYVFTGLQKLVFSTDEKYILSQGVDGTIQGWSVPSCSLLYKINDETFDSVSQDNTFFTSISPNNRINIRNLETGDVLKVLNGQNMITTSMDGKYIATYSFENSVIIWTVME